MAFWGARLSVHEGLALLVAILDQSGVRSCFQVAAPCATATASTAQARSGTRRRGEASARGPRRRGRGLRSQRARARRRRPEHGQLMGLRNAPLLAPRGMGQYIIGAGCVVCWSDSPNIQSHVVGRVVCVSELLMGASPFNGHGLVRQAASPTCARAVDVGKAFPTQTSGRAMSEGSGDYGQVGLCRWACAKCVLPFSL